MPNVTHILSQIESGDPSAAEQLLPLVYHELRKLAAAKLAREKPGQTLQPTALVHEAYLHLVDVQQAQQWDSRGHFFAAAAEAMRRILVECARRKKAEKHGGHLNRQELLLLNLPAGKSADDLLLLDDAVSLLSEQDPVAGKLASMHLFAEYPVEQAGELLGMPRATAYRHWAYARAWLKNCLRDDESDTPNSKKNADN